MNRLEEKYKKEVVPSLMKKNNYKTVMLVPRIEKIVVKMGVGDAVANSKNLEAAVADLAKITGLKDTDFPFKTATVCDPEKTTTFKYDTEELLKDTYEKSEIFFNTYKERFTIEEDAVGYIEDMYNKFDFSGNFKYLSGFISYLKEKRLKK